MKRFFTTLMLMAVATMTFWSCEKDNSLKGSYAYYAPVTNWELTMDGVRAEMKNASGWEEDTEYPGYNEIVYVNSKTNADLHYEFSNEKLRSASILYWGCLDKFETMKKDWEKAYGVEFEEKTVMGMTIWEAKVPNTSTELELQRIEGEKDSYMVVTARNMGMVW